MGLASAVGRVEPKHRRDFAPPSSRAAQPPADVGEEIANAPCRVGVGEEANWLAILCAGLTVDDLRQICREVRFGDRTLKVRLGAGCTSRISLEASLLSLYLSSVARMSGRACAGTAVDPRSSLFRTEQIATVAPNVLESPAGASCTPPRRQLAGTGDLVADCPIGRQPRTIQSYRKRPE